jgi:hypothetical protein
MTFNWIHYRELNPDLVANGIQNESDVVNHYYNHGINENRSISIYDVYPDFNWIQYLSNYSDLKNLFKKKKECEDHWILNGRHEGRIYNKIDKVENIKTCILFHVGKLEIFKEIFYDYKDFFLREDIVIFISTHVSSNIIEIKKLLPNADIEIIQNKGLDVGGCFKNIIRFLKHPLYKQVNSIYFIHTKTNAEWRNNMLIPLLRYYENNEDEILSSNEPVLIGSEKYTYKNNKQVNFIYIKQIYERNKHIFDNYFKEDDLYSLFDKYYHMTDTIDINLINSTKNSLFLNTEFYKKYEPDLNILTNNEASIHYYKDGVYESHRIPNPNFVKQFGETCYFIAGTIFVCNKKYFEIFDSIDLEYEYSILETGYNINDIPRKTHSWEYLFGLIQYARGCNITSIDLEGMPSIKEDYNSFNTLIYKNCNIDLLYFNNTQLIEHFKRSGSKENRIYSIDRLYKRQSIINIDIEQSTIAFFMLIPSCHANSGGYRTLLIYIEFLRQSGFTIDIYFGSSTEDMKTYLGLSIISISIDSILDYVNKYNVLDIDKYNYFLGLNLLKKYNTICANAWQISESVYLNKENSNNMVYIIQDKEELFYPNDILQQEKVRSTYKSEFNYYCLSSYLSNEFSSIVPYSFILKSFLGVDLTIYNNMFNPRNKSIIFAYYTGKIGRLPTLVESIIQTVYTAYKCYIFPDKYTSIVHPNIINLGTITPSELNKVYNSCKIGIIFSNSNPSRLGFEMLASGLQVIEYDSIYTKYDMPTQYFTKILNILNIETTINKMMTSDYTYPLEYINRISINNELNNVLELFNNLK